jgi:hypothetical protein
LESDTPRRYGNAASGFRVGFDSFDVSFGSHLPRIASLTSLRANVDAQYKKIALGRSAKRMGKRGIKRSVRPTVVRILIAGLCGI